MRALKIEELNRVLEGAPSQYWDEVIKYAQYLVYKSENSDDRFFNNTLEDMKSRVERSEADIAAGRTRKLSDFNAEVEEWKEARRATK